jgi:hypothetical protein
VKRRQQLLEAGRQARERAAMRRAQLAELKVRVCSCHACFILTASAWKGGGKQLGRLEVRVGCRPEHVYWCSCDQPLHEAPF